MSEPSSYFPQPHWKQRENYNFQGLVKCKVSTLTGIWHVFWKIVELVSHTLDLHLTAPLYITTLGLVEEAPCTTTVANILAVIPSELTCETLLVNEPRWASEADGGIIGCIGFIHIVSSSIPPPPLPQTWFFFDNWWYVSMQTPRHRLNPTMMMFTKMVQ